MNKVFAHYEVVSQLGAGGMGEVYLARDSRLGRNVAVKVLPEIFATDEDRVGRFQREAKLLAALNHANIAALFGLEEADGRHFLVMELIEGDTLAELIARGPVPVEQALKIAHQIAEALEYAHEKGIIHRDLKPANVKMTPEGRIKVLDFGLAKAMETARPNTNMSNSPTLSMSATNAGVVLGTAAYMSPEQARGSEADPRSDVFSFGCVLYEMLTGRQPFQGDTIADVLAGVLAREPDLSALPANLNPRITELLRRCIEKSPKRRWHAIADTRVEIESIIADPRGLATKAEQSAVKRPLWKRAIPVVVGIVLSGAIAGVAGWYLKPAAPLQVTRFPYVLPDGQVFTNGGRQLLTISPDGSQFVYVANQRLYLKAMRELAPVPIQGTESSQGVLNPVFSPDGRSLVYWVSDNRALKRISVSGGAAVTLSTTEGIFGMSWAPDDTILFGSGPKGIMRVTANGGAAETIIPVNTGEFAHGPQLLPDGKTVLFTVAVGGGSDRWTKSKIVVQRPGSTDRKVIVDGGTDARYLATGHLVYALNGTLLAIPFDVKTLEKRGGPVPLVEGVQMAGINTGTAQFTISDTGSLVYIPGEASRTPQRTLALVDRQGVAKSVLSPGAFESPRVSPNGKQVSFNLNDGEAAVYIYDLSGATSMRRLTFGGRNAYPAWSQDGQRILFRSDRENDNGLFWQRADGTGAAERMLKAEEGINYTPESFAKDGQTFLFSWIKSGSNEASVWIYSFKDKKSSQLIDAPQFQARGVFSPDGKWIAYESNETGRLEVYVQPFPLTGAKYQVTKEGGNHPLWSPDGKELFFMNAVQNGTLQSVSIQLQPSFSFGNPVALPIMGFNQIAAPGNLRNYDITPDGKQFLMVLPQGQSSTEARTSLSIQIVLNWFEDLKQRVAQR